jgi:hypothetical protein
MAAYWQPTTAGYLGRVSKERIREAVREGVSDDAAKRIVSMKKGAMADAAAQLLAGKNWLPTPLPQRLGRRTSSPSTPSSRVSAKAAVAGLPVIGRVAHDRSRSAIGR